MDLESTPRTSVSAGTSATPFTLDTTQSSLLHHMRFLTGRMSAGSAMPTARPYLIAVATVYLPLCLAAILGSLPLATRTATLRLPFFFDWNIALAFLISFPCVLVLILSDQWALNVALNRVQQDGTVTISPDSVKMMQDRWAKRFRITNIAGQALGVACGFILAFFNYAAYSPPSTGYWIATDGHLEPVGYVFLCGLFLFYALIPIYIVRLICSSFLLRDLVKHASLRMLPFHPDRSGGLRPVGRLGLRNQYGLTVLGLNVVSLVVISTMNLNIPTTLYGLLVAAGVAYLVLGPVVFIGPLLPFRAGMIRTKHELMAEIALRLRIELQRLRDQLPSDPISKDDEELIDRIRKIGRVVEELPVWPFDAGTIRTFLTAYVLPLLGAIGYPAINALEHIS